MSAPSISAEARSYFEQGVQLSHNHHTVEQSAAAFENAIQLWPDYAEAYFELGTMYFRWSHFHKAIEPLKKAIELAPGQPPAYYNLGLAYNRAKLYRDAEAILKQFTQAEPDHAEAHFELGFAALQQFNRDKEAINHFREAVRLSPHHFRALRLLGSALVRERDFAGARELVEQLRESNPHQANWLENLISLNDPSD